MKHSGSITRRSERLESKNDCYTVLTHSTSKIARQLVKVTKQILAAKTVLEITILNLEYCCICPGAGFAVDAIRTNQFELFIVQLGDSAPLREYLQNLRVGSYYNLLHICCILNRPKYIKPLLELGCSFVARNMQLVTPLYLAVRTQRLACLNEFTEYFRTHLEQVTANVRILFEMRTNNGQTVFHGAVESKCYEFVEILLKIAATINVKICKIREYHCGNTAAHVAWLHRDYKMIELLLSYDDQACTYANYAEDSVYDLAPHLRERFVPVNRDDRGTFGTSIRTAQMRAETSAHLKSV